MGGSDVGTWQLRRRCFLDWCICIVQLRAHLDLRLLLKRLAALCFQAGLGLRQRGSQRRAVRAALFQ
jgi:hypothetical protein